MNKKEIISAIAEDLGCKKYEATAFLETFEKIVRECVKKEMDFTLPGFITFTTVDVSEREYRNPQNGEVIVKEAHKEVKAKISKKLKYLVME